MFPIDSLIISPQHWKIIKLTGRSIEFDESGIISSMSYMEDHNISTLNISTATTNCTLVTEEELDSALESLKNTFKCPIDR